MIESRGSRVPFDERLAMDPICSLANHWYPMILVGQDAVSVIGFSGRGYLPDLI